MESRSQQAIPGLTDLEKELKHCRVADEHAMSSAVMALEQRFRREIHSSVELVVDSDTHVARTWWPAGTATEPRSDERRGAGVERDRAGSYWSESKAPRSARTTLR